MVCAIPSIVLELRVTLWPSEFAQSRGRIREIPKILVRKLKRTHALALRDRRTHFCTIFAATLCPTDFAEAVLEHSQAVPLEHATAFGIRAVVLELRIAHLCVKRWSTAKLYKPGTTPPRLHLFPECTLTNTVPP